MERIYDMMSCAKSSDEAAVKTGIYATDITSGVIWVVKPGQEVKCHAHPNADDTWIVLKGTGLFHEEVGKDRVVKAGDMIVNPKDHCHGVTNNSDEDFVFVGILSPIPAEYKALV